MSIQFEVIIIGGSYAGLSAALALGRSMRKVLILDNAEPCNRKAAHSHNFITHDGVAPQHIATIARQEVLNYPTVTLKNGKAVKAMQHDDYFNIDTDDGQTFTAKKLLFATGLLDIMPVIPGFSDCWGISVVHCPYCHGYEVRNTSLGILANGDIAFQFCKMIHHWSKDLTLFTNGKSQLSPEQEGRLKQHNITVMEAGVKALEHSGGHLQYIVLEDGTHRAVNTLFSKVASRQHCLLPEKLGSKLTDDGLIETDDFHQTNIKGVYAAGDNATLFRAVSVAVMAGTKAGAFINKQFIEESF